MNATKQEFPILITMQLWYEDRAENSNGQTILDNGYLLWN